MRWMHLSDIHMNKDFNNVMSNILRAELPQFIKENNITVDYLFITGDYRDSAYMQVEGLEEDINQQALNVSKYILNIARFLNISSRQVYLVPGNHDLNRQKDDKSIIHKIKESYHTHRESLNEFERECLLKRFEFFELVDRYIHVDDEAVNRASHRLYKNENADVLCLNTALSCYGEEKEGVLILDSESIRKLVDKTQNTTPLIVLAHHNLKFLTEKEVDNLIKILKGRKAFYLCGHSHQLEYRYDDQLKMWEIMVGTTKYAEGATPIISIVDTSSSGKISKLKFYRYDFAEKTGWRLYQEISQQLDTFKLGFTNRNVKKDTNINFDVYQLPLMQTTASTEIQRLETIKILAGIKADMSILGKKQHLLISSDGLPVNAGIIIGYAFHKNQNIQLSYLNRNMTFSHTHGKKRITFQETINDNLSDGKTLSMYVYIQAKSRDDGRASFDDYINRKRTKNKCAFYFINKENYDESFDLEISAKYLIDRLIEYRENFINQGYKKISVHLFYNGFWGLALLLGNQMPATFPIQIYDYEAMDQKYYKSYLLQSTIFDIKQ